jgi:hypothetical protein
MPAAAFRTTVRESWFSLFLALILPVAANITGCSGGGTSTAPSPITAPSISTQPAAQAGYVDETATFAVTATGTAPLTYVWQKNGTQVSSGSSASYTTPVLAVADDGASYTVVISNSKGSVTSSAAKLSVSLRPVSITTQPAAASVTIGANATFSVSAAGTAPITYQWTRNGTAISGATTASYTLTHAALADSGALFGVTVSNGAGSVASSAAQLTVTDVPAVITHQPSDVSLFVGETATLTVAATGTGLQYQWYRNSSTIPGATGPSYTTPIVAKTDDNAAYDVDVSNSAGVVISSKAILHIGPFVTSYTTQKGVKLNMFAWPGAKNALLTRTENYNPIYMRKIVNAADAAYNYYSKTVGKEPGLYFNYNGLATIANTGIGGIDLCGAGCTYIGATGMEIDDNTMADLYNRIQNDDYNWVIFYEFGRSFWLFGNQLSYKSPDNSSCETTGFAVYMGIHTLQALNYKSDYGTNVPDNPDPMKEELNNLLLYTNDSSLNFQNTFQVDTFKQGSGGCSVLWSGLVEKLKRTYGGEAFVQQLFKESLKRPTVNSTQDAIDNFILAASAAAGKNLTYTFGTTWKWPISSAALKEAQDNWGTPQ